MGNSASYTMHIADTGLTREDFTKFTRTSGANARTPECFDKYGNCPDLAKNCCYNRMVGGGMLLHDACCAACTFVSESGKCNSENANCYDKYSNCKELVKMEFQCQRKEVALGCCTSCKKVESE